MRVYLRAFGPLREYFGRQRATIELPDGASLGVLLLEIDARWGNVMPAHLWDTKNKRFQGPVVLMCNSRALKDPSVSLREDQEIQAFKVLVGG